MCRGCSVADPSQARRAGQNGSTRCDQPRQAAARRRIDPRLGARSGARGDPWNKIEHRPFSFVTQNWRGKPLISYLVIVQLIASTTTDTGLTVACRLDDSDYAKGIKVTDAEMAALNIQPADFHGEWNYTIAPRWPDG